MALTYASQSQITAGDVARANSLAAFNAQQAARTEPNAYGWGVGVKEMAGSPLMLPGSQTNFTNADLGKTTGIVPNTPVFNNSSLGVQARIPIASGVAGPSVPQQVGANNVEQMQGAVGAITPLEKPSQSPPLKKVISAPAPAAPSMQPIINNPAPNFESSPALTPWQSLNGSLGTWKRLMESNFYNGPLAQRANQRFFGSGGF